MILIIIALWGALIFGFTMLCGLIWMLGLGVLAGIFHNPDLAIGYWQSVALALFANMLLGVITVRFKKNQ